MRPRLRRRVLGVVVLVAVAVLAASRTERAGAWGCRVLTERLPAMVGGPASIGRCEFDVLTLSAKVHDVTLFEDDGESHFISIDEASIGLRGLFLGGVSVRELSLVRPRVHVKLTTPTSSPPPKRETCALDRLKAIRVQALHVEEGTFSISLPDGRSLRADGVQVDANVGRATAEAEVRVRSGVVHLSPERALTLGRVHLEGTVDLSARELEMRRADVALEGISLGASGTVSLCDAVPQLAATAQLYVPMEALPRLGVQLEAPRGQLWARVSVAGHADAPLVRADVQASQIALGRFTPGDFTGQLAWSGKTVTVEALRFKVGEGEVRVAADIGLTAGFPVRARFETNEVSLAQVLDRAGVPGAWVDFPATVKGSVSGKLLPVPSLIGDVDFRTGHFTLATHAYNEPANGRAPTLTFGASRGKFHLEITDTWVDFQDIALSVGASGRSTFTGSTRLFYDSHQGLQIRVAAPSIDLADFGAISGLPWSGVGSAQATLTGPGADLKVDGHLTLRDFTLRGYALGIVQSPVTYSDDTLSFPSIAAQKGRTQYFGDVALHSAPEGLQTRASVQLPDGRVEDVVDLLADLSPSMKNLQGVLFGKVSAVALVDGPAKTFNGVVAVRARDAVYLERRLGDADTVIRFVDGEALVLEPTRFVGPLGTTSVDGTWRFAGPLDYRLDVTNGSLQELIDPSESLAVSGGFHAAGTVSGDTDTVRANATLTSSDVHLRGHPLGASSLAFDLVGRALKVSGTVVPGVTGNATITAQDAWPAAVSLLVELPDASAWLPPSVTGLSLALAGAVTAKVPLRDVRSGHGTATLSKLAVARTDVAAANVEPVELEWNDGALTVHSLVMRGPTSELKVEGGWGPLVADLKGRGAIDARLASSLAPDLERAAGRIDFTAAVTGPVTAPTLVGTADLSDGRFSVKGQDLAVRSLSGHAEFSDSRVLVQDVQGFLNDGRLRVRGDVRLEGLGVKSMEIQADLEDVTLRPRPDLPATVSGSLLLASKKGGLMQLSGGLDVVKFRYVESLSFDGVLASARAQRVPSDDKPNEWLRLDVDVALGDDVRIENNLARTRLLGKVKVGGTNVKPVLVGAIEVAEGAQAFFRNNTFAVSRGVLQFNGLWPTFDVSARSQVREYLVNVKAFGRFDDPKVSLVSEPALSEADVVSLLTLGVTTRERLDTTSGAGLAAEALLSASGLDQQVQRFLSRNVGLKDQKVRLTTSFNEATGTAEPSVTWESKMLSDNLKVGVTQPVTGRGTKAQAEYRFNDRVSARAQWDNQNQNTTVGNPGVDLRFRFEWE